MSTGLLFVTAPEADHKQINLLLLHLRDWENGFDGDDDGYKLVTTKNAYDLEQPADSNERKSQTSPPLSSGLDNAWAGAALEDVEAFCLDLARNEDISVRGPYNNSLYVVVDSTGLQAHTCILGHRASDDEAADFTWLDRFDKMRVPWELLHSPFCNLDIANMNFEEFTLEGEEGGEVEDGWYTFKDVSEGDDELSDDNRKLRDEEIQRFRDAGHI